jgi:hypothetical protein
MVIDDLNLVSVTFAEFKTDTPAIVDRHRPLALAIALELVKTDAFQRA